MLRLRRIPRLLGAALAVGAAVPGAAAAGTRVVATVDAATPLSAYGGVLAYSVRSPLDGRFHLMLDRNGVSTAAPVASRAVPFDVDLGPGVDGRTVAVYSRCATEPRTSSFAYDTPFLAPGRECRVRRLDLGTGREVLLQRTHTAGRSEYLPTIWKGNVAFASTRADGRGVPQLALSTAGGPPRPLSAGPARACRRLAGRVECLSTSGTSLVSMDLRVRRVAFSWRYRDFGEGGWAHEVRLVAPQQHSRVVARTSSGGLTTTVAAWPVFDGPAVFYAQACFGDSQGCPRRYGVRRLSLPDGTTTGTPLVSRLTSWFTRGGGEDFTLVTTAGGTCDPAQLDPGQTPCRIVATSSAARASPR